MTRPVERGSRVLEPNICSALGCSRRSDAPEKEFGHDVTQAGRAYQNGATALAAQRRPYYVPVGNEEQVFKAAYRQGLSVLLKGPTGCGKTRFVEAMAHDLGRPLITVRLPRRPDDRRSRRPLPAAGRRDGWVDGPLTRAVREGAICYLDEVVEARQDTTVVLHPLADHRRQLPIDRLGVTLDAAPGFCLVVSYNPGYQSVLKDLKDSTRQRMVAIELDFPPATSRRRSSPTRPASTTTARRSWCGSARRSAASKPAACARWRRPGC